jgi:hypothetical protein
MSIEILDAVKVAQLQRCSDPAGRYLGSLINRGPAHFIDNAKVRMEALMIDDKILPLVISERVAGNSNVCSSYAHYFEYAFHEFAKRHGQVALALIKPPRAMLGAVLRNGSIDRAVSVNNWLFTTNPRHGLSSPQIAELTAHLTRRYPDSAIVFRSLNPTSDMPGLEALRVNRYRLVPSRRVYVLDPRSQRYLAHADARRDLGKLRKTRYSIVETFAAIAPHFERMAAFYCDLYLGKHSPLNPHYDAEFFALTLKDGFLSYRAFMEDGRLDAFVSFFVEDGLMTAALLGYDLNRPRKLGLYRLAFALLIDEASRRNVLLNMSGGAGDFKMLRGAELVQEYDAVYDRHLPFARRLRWGTVYLAAQVGRLLP